MVAPRALQREELSHQSGTARCQGGGIQVKFVHICFHFHSRLSFVSKTEQNQLFRFYAILFVFHSYQLVYVIGSKDHGLNDPLNPLLKLNHDTEKGSKDHGLKVTLNNFLN